MPLTPAEKTRRYHDRRLAEIEQMPKIPCACGCGTLIAPINKRLKPAAYVHGHNSNGVAKGRPSPLKGRPNPAAGAAHRGKKLPPEEIARRQATRLANNGGVYQVKRGWKLSDATREKMSVRAKGFTGAKNPFYGKAHTPEARERISERLSGRNGSGWRGGTPMSPYGTAFTRKFKKLIRERDNYTCQRCGKTQEDDGRVLQVHHLDHDKMHNDPTNLVTSCGSCNVWASYHRDEPFKP